MSHAGKQFSLLQGIGSGAGALAIGTAVDQTGNLLNIPTTIMTPNVKVGHGHTNFKGKKVRFGGVGPESGHMFDYPDLAVKRPEGNGQSYKASKAGYLPGNNGGGTAGFGTSIDFDRQTLVSEDLLAAQSVAMREAHINGDMYAVEHTRSVNRAEESIREHMEEQAKEHEKEKIAHLMAMGFSEEEIARKAAKDREKAIEQAGKLGRIESKTLTDKMISQRGNVEMFFNNSIAPGLMPQRINADSYQRAVGAGTLVTKGKAAEAMRRREKMALKIDTEKPHVKVPMKHAEIVKVMMEAAGKEEHKRIEESAVQEHKVIAHQKMREDARVARHFAMMKAMEK